MATHGQESQRDSFSIKRRRSMDTELNAPKKLKMKQTVAEVVRSTLNLLPSNENRNQSFPHKLVSDHFTQDSCISNISHKSSSFLRCHITDDPQSHDVITKANLSNCRKSSFEDDYHDDIDENLNSVIWPMCHGFKMDASVFKSVNTVSISTVKGTIKTHSRRRKFSHKRHSSLPDFSALNISSSSMLTNEDLNSVSGHADDNSKSHQFISYSLSKNIAADDLTADNEQCDNLTADNEQCDNLTADSKQCGNLTADNERCDNFTADSKQCDNLTADSERCANLIADSERCDVQNHISSLPQEDMPTTKDGESNKTSINKSVLQSYNAAQPAQYDNVSTENQDNFLRKVANKIVFKFKSGKDLYILNNLDISHSRNSYMVDSPKENESEEINAPNFVAQSRLKHSKMDAFLSSVERKYKFDIADKKIELSSPSEQAALRTHLQPKMLEPDFGSCKSSSSHKHGAEAALPSEMISEFSTSVTCPADLKRPDCILSTLDAERLPGVQDQPNDFSSQTTGGLQISKVKHHSPPGLIPESTSNEMKLPELAKFPFKLISCHVGKSVNEFGCGAVVSPSFSRTCNILRGDTASECSHPHKKIDHQVVSDTMPIRPSEGCSSGTKLGQVNHNLVAQSDWSDFSELDENCASSTRQTSPCLVSPQRQESLASHSNTTALIKGIQTSLNNMPTPLSKIPTPLSTSSPSHTKLKSLNHNHDLLSLPDLLSPVRQNPNMPEFAHTIDTPQLKRRRRRNVHLRHRLALLNKNNNQTDSSDEELEVISPPCTDYLLLKKAADFVTDRILFKKQLKHILNMQALVEYLCAHYKNEIIKFSRSNIETISDYRQVMTDSSSVFGPDRLTVENCLSSLLTAVLVNNCTIVEVCLAYIFENLHFLIKCPDFLKIPPELLLLCLRHDFSIVLGHHKFPLSVEESELEMQRVVRRYIRQHKICKGKNELEMRKIISLFIGQNSALRTTGKMDETNSTKRPKHQIVYVCSNIYVTAQYTRQNNLLKPCVTTAPNYLVVCPTQSPDNDIRSICSSAYTLRKIYFLYRQRNSVPYITHIGMQYIHWGKKIVNFIGRRPVKPASRGNLLGSRRHSEHVPVGNSDVIEDLTSLSTSAAAAAPFVEADIDDGNFMSLAEGDNAKLTAVKMSCGEHVTGISVQGHSALHNIMIHTNTGRRVRAHNISDFYGETAWALIPPPATARFCLQAISAQVRTTSTGTHLQNVAAVWAVLSIRVNNLGQ